MRVWELRVCTGCGHDTARPTNPNRRAPELHCTFCHGEMVTVPLEPALTPEQIHELLGVSDVKAAA